MTATWAINGLWCLSFITLVWKMKWSQKLLLNTHILFLLDRKLNYVQPLNFTRKSHNNSTKWDFWYLKMMQEKTTFLLPVQHKQQLSSRERLRALRVLCMRLAWKSRWESRNWKSPIQTERLWQILCVRFRARGSRTVLLVWLNKLKSSNATSTGLYL